MDENDNCNVCRNAGQLPIFDAAHTREPKFYNNKLVSSNSSLIGKMKSIFVVGLPNTRILSKLSTVCMRLKC